MELDCQMLVYRSSSKLHHQLLAIKTKTPLALDSVLGDGQDLRLGPMNLKNAIVLAWLSGAGIDGKVLIEFHVH